MDIKLFTPATLTHVALWKTNNLQSQSSTIPVIVLMVILAWTMPPYIDRAAAQSFGPLLNLSSNIGHSQYPQLVGDGTRVYVFWDDYTFVEGSILFRRSDNSGLTWVPDLAEPAAVLDRGVTSPRVGVAGSAVYVVHPIGSMLHLKRSFDSGASFDDQMVSVGHPFAEEAQIVVAQDHVYLAYMASLSGNRGVFLRRSLDRGETWDPPLDQPGRLISIGVDPHLHGLRLFNNLLFAVWVDGDVYISRSVDDGLNFVSQGVSNSLLGANWLDFAIDGTNAYLAFSQAGQIFLSQSVNSGATWTRAIQLSSTPASEPKLYVAGSNVAIVWLDQSVVYGNVMRLRRSLDNGATWDPPLSEEARPIVSNVGLLSETRLAQREAEIYVTLLTQGAGIVLAQSADVGGTWQTQSIASPPSFLSGSMQLAISGSRIYAAWSEGPSNPPFNLDVVARVESDACTQASFASRYPLGLGQTEPVITGRWGGDAIGVQKSFKGHLGVDYGAGSGTSVVAAACGRVCKVDDVGKTNWGKYVLIHHTLPDDTFRHSLYAHLSEVTAIEGRDILAGESVGLSGATGKVGGPHLHFGILNDKFCKPGKGYSGKSFPESIESQDAGGRTYYNPSLFVERWK